MTKTAKRKPPSRVRYERSHPTVSCRVPRELYDRLEKARKTERRSFADFLKIGLGVVEAQARKEEGIREQAYGEGYEGGYTKAQYTYVVTYRCNVCGQSITESTTAEKEAIREYMNEHGWGHGECHDKR